MALYVGNHKVKIISDDAICRLYLGMGQSSMNDTLLASLDDYILQDSYESYLAVKSGE